MMRAFATRGTWLAIGLICAPLPAAAHGSQAAWAGSYWTYDPWVVAPLYACGTGYLLGTQRLWTRAGLFHGISARQVVFFWTGWSALALALISPLHWWGERLFVAHMIEHCILIAVAAPLIVAARPTAAFLWSVPKQLAVGVAAFMHWRPVATLWQGLINPWNAAVLHGAVLWAWHMPLLYRLTLIDIAWHRLEHLSFVLTAMLFWWSLWRGGHHAAKVGALFLTTLHSGLLGLLLTLSPRLWYPAQSILADEWSLTALQDQQLAGLVMWVPMSCVYTAAALFVASIWISRASVASLHAPHGAHQSMAHPL